MKKLSIVTITYNDLDNLKKTVQSVLKELKDDIEYIIIDGASTDGTVNYLRTLDNSKIIIISETDKGIYNAMNKGIKKALGEWLIFLNAGDVLLPGVLNKFSYLLNDDKDCLYGDIFLSLYYKDKQFYKLEQASKEIDIEVLKKHMQFSHQAFLCKKSILIKVKGFDEQFKTAADWDLIIRIALASYRFEHISTPIAIYDKTGVSSKPHPNEKHRIRKKNRLYRWLDVQYIRDLIQAGYWYVAAFLLRDNKVKYQIKYRRYTEEMIYKD